MFLITNQGFYFGMARSLLFILLTITGIAADPLCVTRGTDVVCSAGEADHILDRGLVSENNRTTAITLRNCRITDLEYEAFHQLPSLKYVDLSVNKIRRLKLGVLDEFKTIEHLNISYNNLKRFPLGLFDQIPNLKLLDLKGNQLEYIELGVFDPLTKLTHLDLSSNPLLMGKNLNPYIFDQSHKITFMDFSRNDMSDTPDNILEAFEAIEFLNLDRCSLVEVPDFALSANLKTMKHLMLSANRITTLTDPSLFTHLIHLEILNLVGNLIEDIHADFFKPSKNVKNILLNNNIIKNLPDTLFQNLRNLEKVHLSNNRLETVPVNAFRGTNLKVLNIKGNRFTYLQDNFCLELRNSGVRLKTFYFTNNHWQCACLNDVLIEVKKYGITYDKDKYKGRQPVCVTTKDFHCKRQSSSNEYYRELYNNII